MRDDVKILPYEPGQTNFPRVGHNCKVSLAYSEFALFDVVLAKHIREAHPNIWALGQPHPDMFDHLVANFGRKRNRAATPVEEMAIRYREAWASRNQRLPLTLDNVMRQVHWLVVGHKGSEAMLEVLRKEGVTPL